jgi:hypothetical protein
MGHGSHRKVENKSEAYQCPFCCGVFGLLLMMNSTLNGFGLYGMHSIYVICTGLLWIIIDYYNDGEYLFFL